jgi:hypothetical protein
LAIHPWNGAFSPAPPHSSAPLWSSPPSLSTQPPTSWDMIPKKIDTGITGSLACLICCNMCIKYSKMSCLSSKPFHFDFHDSPFISSSIDTFLKLWGILKETNKTQTRLSP